MKTFTDVGGRTWSVVVNVAAVKRVRDLLGLDPLEIDKFFPKVLGDLVTACDVLYAVCKPEADARGISDSDFGAALAGDVIETAVRALVEELIDFFPRSEVRTSLRAAVARFWRVMEAVAQRASAQAEAETDELPPEVEAALKSAGVSSTSSPA